VEALYRAITLLAQPQTALVVLLSAFYGLFVGAMPGLTATMAVALMIPFTFYLDPITGLAAIITMEAMAIFAGDIPGALIRMPGTPASAAYTEDSYALTKQGRAELALGLDLVCSVIGGIVGAVAFIVAAPLLLRLALYFTSFEYFWLAVLALGAASLVSSGAPLKGAISAVVGLTLSTVGIDITMGYPRFTFGNINLLSGLGLIPVMIGLFGVSEVIRSVIGRDEPRPVSRIRPSHLFRGIYSVLTRHRPHIVRGSVVGTVIGALPGTGADLAAWLSVGVAKRFSKAPEKFGKGSVEPIIEAGTSNNAALAAAWIPALVFGIPGDNITAIVIGVLMMKGLRPGPLLFQQQADLLNTLRVVFVFANLLMLPLGYAAIRVSSAVVRAPRNMLMPVILGFCIVGAFALENNPFDVLVMLAMGVVGYVMERNGFPVAPAVLGLVLGPLVEQNFMISIIKADWHIAGFFTRPTSGVLAALAISAWLLPVLAAVVRRPRQIAASA
jgi:TctA family transporter